MNKKLIIISAVILTIPLLALALNYGELPARLSMNAYYRLEDVNDASGNGRTLTNYGTSPFNFARFAKGWDGGQTNTTKYLSTANQLGIDGGIMTMSAWVKFYPGHPVGREDIVEQANGASKVYQLLNVDPDFINFSRTNQGTTGGCALTIASSTPDYVSASKFVNVVYVYDGTNLNAYSNGKFYGSCASSGSGISATLDGFSIGALMNGANTASAIIDEVIVEARAWSAKEVGNYYNQAKGRMNPRIIQ